MARMRAIKPSFFSNEDLASLPAHARLLFIGLWTLADREGRLEDRPSRIKAEIFPYEPRLGVGPLLTGLVAKGFITRYTVEDIAVIQIVKFSKHQRPNPREIPSVLPQFVPEQNLGNARHEKDEARSHDLGAGEPLTVNRLTVNGVTGTGNGAVRAQSVQDRAPPTEVAPPRARTRAQPSQGTETREIDLETLCDEYAERLGGRRNVKAALTRAKKHGRSTAEEFRAWLDADAERYAVVHAADAVAGGSGAGVAEHVDPYWTRLHERTHARAIAGLSDVPGGGVPGDPAPG